MASKDFMNSNSLTVVREVQVECTQVDGRSRWRVLPGGGFCGSLSNSGHLCSVPSVQRARRAVCLSLAKRARSHVDKVLRTARTLTLLARRVVVVAT
eukprot:5126045-Amphidinium_carterae.1